MVQGESGIPEIALVKLIFTRSELHGGTKLVLLQFAESQPILVILEISRHGVLLKHRAQKGQPCSLIMLCQTAFPRPSVKCEGDHAILNNSHFCAQVADNCQTFLGHPNKLRKLSEVELQDDLRNDLNTSKYTGATHQSLHISSFCMRQKR